MSVGTNNPPYIPPIDPGDIVTGGAEAVVTPEIPTGEILGGQRVVISGADGKLYTADSSDVSHIGKVLGITRQAYLAGVEGEVISGGTFEDPSFSFTPSEKLYFDAAGVLTHSIPTTGFVQVMGHAISSTKIFIAMKTPVIL